MNKHQMTLGPAAFKPQCRPFIRHPGGQAIPRRRSETTSLGADPRYWICATSAFGNIMWTPLEPLTAWVM